MSPSHFPIDLRAAEFSIAINHIPDSKLWCLKMTFSVQSEKSCSDHLLSIFWQKQKFIILDCISWSLTQNIPSSQIHSLKHNRKSPTIFTSEREYLNKTNLKGHSNIDTAWEKTSPNSSSHFSLIWHYKPLISHFISISFNALWEQEPAIPTTFSPLCSMAAAAVRFSFSRIKSQEAILQLQWVLTVISVTFWWQEFLFEIISSLH